MKLSPFSALAQLWLILFVIMFMVVACNTAAREESSMQPIVIPTSESTMGSEPTHFVSTARKTMGVFFPQQATMPGRSVASGALTGRLTVVGGCLRVYREEGNTSYLVIWPPNAGLRVEHSAIQILNAAGQVVASVGDNVFIGGGEIPTFAGLKAILQPIQQYPSEECPAPYWLASEARDIYRLP